MKLDGREDAFHLINNLFMNVSNQFSYIYWVNKNTLFVIYYDNSH